MLEDENDFQRADIHIEPPPVDDVTDEDSGDEDEVVAVNNLPGRQLSEPASVMIVRQDERTIISNDTTGLVNEGDTASSGSDTDSYEVPDDIPMAGTSRKTVRVVLKETGQKRKAARTPAVKRKWKKCDIPNAMTERFIWHNPNIDCSNLPQSPDSLFSLFFDDEVLEMLVTNTQLYAGSKGRHGFTTTKEEMKTFIAILLVSGYSPVPRRRMYWSFDDDIRNEAVSKAMTRDRFEEMMRYMHISDNNRLDLDDKFSKVRPLLAMLNERFLLYFLKEKNLSIDESMIPYYGRHGAKQFIRGKPIRFGYKMWALTTALGYVLQFEPYQGARGRQATDNDNLGMGGAVVMDLLAELNRDNGYHLTFDNLFSSLKLVDKLTSLGIACTGTIRANRVEDCPLRPSKEMEKTPRGTFDRAFDASSGLVIVRWNDNNIVNVVSNQHGVAPLQTATRWSRAERRVVRVDQPFAISHYNKTMGGVDRMDQNVEKYRVAIRSKKWWWPVFAYCLDLAVQQSWHLYRATDTGKTAPLDLLGIRRAIVKVWLAQVPRRASSGRPQKGRPVAAAKRVPDAIRFDGKNHYAMPSKQKWCAACGKHCNTMCTKCDIGLHRRCFELYHTE